MVREIIKKKTKVKVLNHNVFKNGDLELYINDEIEKLEQKFVGTTNTDLEIKNISVEGKDGETKRVVILYSYTEHSIVDDI